MQTDAVGLLQAQKYAALRKPYLINDMQLQDLLLDRRRVYQTLQVSCLLHASYRHIAFLPARYSVINPGALCHQPHLINTSQMRANS